MVGGRNAGPDTQKTVAQKARASVADFLGVGGETREEWQEGMNKWHRRSVALHTKGRLLAKVDATRQSMHHPVSSPAFGQTKVAGTPEPSSQVKRPSVFKLGYDYFRDKMDESKMTSDQKQKRAPPLTSPHTAPSYTDKIKKKARFAEPEEEAPDRELGKGLVGDLLKREYRKSRMITEVRMNMASLTTYRPFFTYWVTFVQVAIYIVTVAIYGLGPIGIGYRKITGSVPKVHMTIESAHYMQEQNLWIGPTPESLIHVGAKFSPCMRTDHNVEAAIKYDRDQERTTACCIYNDGSGCVQSSRSGCSALLSIWKKWPDEQVNRTSGSVCGEDPRVCKNPPPTSTSKWPDDITQWPICLENASVPNVNEYTHMTCELTGRPCCVGIQGLCIITSDQHCKFLQGYFHPNATLCSQVYCMNAICGMIPFYTKDTPDQFGRLITSQFLHAGLLQLFITIIYQGFIMRDLEKLIGWLRLAIIYIFSGMIGSLASAIFLPYHVEAGPSGSQFGIAACLFVEVIQNWYILFKPWLALLKLVGILLVLFIIGLLPMIDNYAHLFGFLYGFLLAFALMPYITFNLKDRQHKLIGVIVCLVLAVILLAILVLLFYVTPIHHCSICKYFNCVPFTDDFCVGMEIKISRNDTWYN